MSPTVSSKTLNVQGRAETPLGCLSTILLLLLNVLVVLLLALSMTIRLTRLEASTFLKIRIWRSLPT